MWKSVMTSRKAASAQPPTPTTPPPSIFDLPSSDESTSPCSSIFDDDEVDTSGDDLSSLTSMSHDSLPPSRSLTVSIPQTQPAHGPYSTRRPNLSEILANTAPPPWTLSAFMAYLSQNHCLETLEFTMDASRYRKHFEKMASRVGGDASGGTSNSPTSPVVGNEEVAYVKMLWQRLLDAYIAPNAPREVNLPSDVRDSLLVMSEPYSDAPAPLPSALDPAVSKIYELMEESVLVPFLNSMYPPSAHPDAMDVSTSIADESSHTDSDAPRLPHASHTHSNASSSHIHLFGSRTSASSNATRTRSGTHSRLTSTTRAILAPSSAAAASTTSTASAPPTAPFLELAGITDDSGSGSGSGSLGDTWASPATSLSGISDLMMTPPTTPPTSEYGGGGSALVPAAGTSSSPRNSRVDPTTGSASGSTPSSATATATPWRRVGHKLGFKKSSRSSPSARDDDEMGGW